MANDPVPETTALAIGKLIGNMEGLMKMLEQQNIDSAKYRVEQTAKDTQNRTEFMEVFKGIRSDIKDQALIMQAHFDEDAKHHQLALDTANWRKDAEPKVDSLWDAQNTQKGWMVAIGAIGTFVGGAIIAGIEYFKK